MTIAEQIEDYLRHLYSSGKTQTEIAENAGITQPHIQRILADRQKILGISVKTLMKLFPNATLNIDGKSVIAGQTGTNNGVVGVNNGTVSSDCVSAVMDKILAAEELSDAEKIKVLKVLKK